MNTIIIIELKIIASDQDKISNLNKTQTWILVKMSIGGFPKTKKQHRPPDGAVQIFHYRWDSPGASEYLA